MKSIVGKVGEAPQVNWDSVASIETAKLESGYAKFDGLGENRGQERI